MNAIESYVSVTIFGIRFWNRPCEALLQEMDAHGGVLTVPSAPSLGQAGDDTVLMDAYRSGDWSVVDGGYAALVFRGLGVMVRRISGLQIIEKTFARNDDHAVPMHQRRILWVMPSEDEQVRTQNLLQSKGFKSELQHFYQAPFYKSDEEFKDEELIRQAREFAPEWIVICLGGGRQEKLAYHLRRADWDASVLAKRFRGPAILCTGAAIAFFTGGQVGIPRWADRLYLGWAFRTFKDPRTCVPRYLRALWHFPRLVFRNGDELRHGPRSRRRVPLGA